MQITATKKDMNLILVYGLGSVPMMLATNLTIKNKEDVTKVIMTYMSRWRIEEYFKFKKQEYGFESFRVRNLKAINNLNKMLSYSLGVIAMLAEKQGKSALVYNIIRYFNSLRDNLLLWSYQISRGIYKISSFIESYFCKTRKLKKILTCNLWIFIVKY